MLPTTQQLLDYLQLPAARQNGTVRLALVHSVLAAGSLEDARALLAQYLTQPFGFEHADLLPVFGQHGDVGFADAVYAACCPGGELHPDAPTEVLTLLGQLGHAASKPLLARYAFGPADYYQAKHAALGLLHLDCQELLPTIRAAIGATHNKNLFPEFVPALVCKLPDRADVLARLYQSGTEYCSTDCNAGILLGFSLCGADGIGYFKQALFSPAWEVHASGTGTRWYAYQGLLNLGLTFRELFAEARQLTNPADLKYALQVLLELLRIKVGPYHFTPASPELFADLYPVLFGAELSDGPNLPDLAASAGLEEEARQVETFMVLRLHQELILRNLS